VRSATQNRGMLHTFSTLGCPELPLDEVIGLADRHGIDVLELRALGGTVELPAYFLEHYQTPERLAARLAEAGKRVVALDTSFRLIGNKPTDRKALQEFMPWAEALGGPRLRVFDSGTTLTEAELAEAVATLAWWQAERRAGGWASELMVETHDALVTSAALRRFLAAAPAGTALLWDAHHTWKKGGEDPVATWATVRGHTCHVHVKDSVSRPSERHPFSYVLPGDGEFPMAALRRALEADGFAGPLSLEWELKWHPYLEPLDRALAVAAERRWW
jgi:sugar phosphate isomerase/epimerase